MQEFQALDWHIYRGVLCMGQALRNPNVAVRGDVRIQRWLPCGHVYGGCWGRVPSWGLAKSAWRGRPGEVGLAGSAWRGRPGGVGLAGSAWRGWPGARFLAACRQEVVTRRNVVSPATPPGPSPAILKVGTFCGINSLIGSTLCVCVCVYVCARDSVWECLRMPIL